MNAFIKQFTKRDVAYDFFYEKAREIYREIIDKKLARQTGRLVAEQSVLWCRETLQWLIDWYSDFEKSRFFTSLILLWFFK
jgi:hypothetical protein